MSRKFLLFLLFPIAAILTPRFSVGQNDANNPCIENMTSAERDIISQPVEGSMIFNTTTGCLNYYQNKRWRVFCETQQMGGDNVEFDPNTGKLRYLINGQWYSFSMEGQEQKAPEEQFVIDNQPLGQKGSTASLPVDCRKKPTRPYAGRDLVSFDFVNLEANTPNSR